MRIAARIVVGKEELPACRMIVADAGWDRMPRRRHNPKSKAAGVAPCPRRFPWSVSYPISPLLPVVILVPILPPQWYPSSIPVGENCAAPQRFLPLHYRCPCPMVRNGGSTGSAGSPEAPEVPEAPEGSEKSEGIG